jgi:hypothetical protein
LKNENKKYIDNSDSYMEHLVPYMATLAPYIEELVSYTCNAKINLDVDTLISYIDDMIYILKNEFIY